MATAKLVETNPTVHLELTLEEAQVVHTLVAHIAQNKECYAIGSALDEAGIEWTGDSFEPSGRDPHEYFIQRGTFADII